MPDKIWSFSSGATTSMVVKIELKKLLWFFFVQYMPHGNCSTAFVSQDIYKLLTIHGSIDPGQQLLHKIFWFK